MARGRGSPFTLSAKPGTPFCFDSVPGILVSLFTMFIQECVMQSPSNEFTRRTITQPSPVPPSTLDALNFGLAEGEEVVVPVMKPAYLKWINSAVTDTETTARGWHLDKGVDPRIDETLEDLGMRSYIVEHLTEDEDGETHKPYWLLSP